MRTLNSVLFLCAPSQTFSWPSYLGPLGSLGSPGVTQRASQGGLGGGRQARGCCGGAPAAAPGCIPSAIQFGFCAFRMIRVPFSTCHSRQEGGKGPGVVRLAPVPRGRASSLRAPAFSLAFCLSLFFSLPLPPSLPIPHPRLCASLPFHSSLSLFSPSLLFSSFHSAAAPFLFNRVFLSPFEWSFCFQGEGRMGTFPLLSPHGPALGNSWPAGWPWAIG